MNKIKVIVRKISTEYIEKNYELLVASLYRERWEAVKKFKSRKAAYTSIAAGRLLQDVISRELGLLPEEIMIGRSEHDKPYLEGHEDFKFNISHSGDFVVLAYGKDDVGVDIEHIRGLGSTGDVHDYERRTKRDMDVAERFFCPSEAAFIHGGKVLCLNPNEGKGNMNDNPCNINFTLTWTMKESYIKYRGCGMSIPLNSFEIDYEKSCVKNIPSSFYYWMQGEYVVCVCTQKKSVVEVSYEENWITCILKDD